MNTPSTTEIQSVILAAASEASRAQKIADRRPSGGTYYNAVAKAFPAFYDERMAIDPHGPQKDMAFNHVFGEALAALVRDGRMVQRTQKNYQMYILAGTDPQVRVK